MKFSKKILTESLNQPKSGVKVYTEGKKQSIVLSEEQFERLISTVNESNEEEITKLIKESHKLIRESIITESLGLNYDNYLEIIVEQGQYDRNPGTAAAEGLENVLDGIKKAYDMIKDSDTRKKLANSITKLGNFMTYTAELVGSGSSQRKPRSYDQVSKPIPHPEFEVEIEEDVKPDFLDLDDDGDKKESMKKASKDMKKEETIIASNVDDPSQEVVLQEDIRKMKQIIKPISKSVLKEDNSCEGLESDCDMNFVNKYLFTSPPDAKYKRTPLTMVQWGGYDDRQRKILMDKAENVSKGSSIADA